MTANDKTLIAKARRLNPINWGEADAMAKKADTDEARQELKSIASMKYHQEEASIGLL